MPIDPCETAKIIPVADGLFVRQAVDNMAWMDLGDYAVVVDALEQGELEGEVFAAIRKTMGDKKVRYVLNTHTHYDHVALNGAFQNRYGAEIVNAETRRIADDGVWFEGPRRRVLLLPMPLCHTAEDCVVRVEPDKALFVGDIFGWGLIPRDLGRGTAELLVNTYNRLIEFGASTVVPGHGPICATAELKRWVDYFNWLRATIGRACAAGTSDSQIRRETPPPDDMRTWWRFLQWKHEDSVSKVLAAARRGW